MKKIFVGGYGGTGSRVFQKILQLGGYYIGETHDHMLDWFGKNYCTWAVSDLWYHSKKEEPMRTMLLEEAEGHDSWSFKVGHLMYSFEFIKQVIPDCYCVLTIRHPLDTLTNVHYNMHYTHGRLPGDAPMSDRLDFYAKAHENALQYTDFIFKLEDMVFDTHNYLKKVLEFAELPIEGDLTKYTEWIVKPSTIGRGKDYYQQLGNHPIMERLGYKNINW